MNDEMINTLISKERLKLAALEEAIKTEENPKTRKRIYEEIKELESLIYEN